jgi:hypothetical protein
LSRKNVATFQTLKLKPSEKSGRAMDLKILFSRPPRFRAQVVATFFLNKGFKLLKSYGTRGEKCSYISNSKNKTFRKSGRS